MKPQEIEHINKLKIIEQTKIDILMAISKASEIGLKPEEIFGAIESAKHLAINILNEVKINPISEKNIEGYR